MNCTGKRCIMQFDKVDPATCECVSYCPQATPPKTNADRIRSMSNEELTQFLFYYGGSAPNCRVSKIVNGCTSCRVCWFDWLKEEADG